MNLQSPDKFDIELTRFFLSLKKALETRTQLLPYLRKQILDDTEKNFSEISDQEVKEYLQSKR
jgi:hypothetical protein